MTYRLALLTACLLLAACGKSSAPSTPADAADAGTGAEETRSLLDGLLGGEADVASKVEVLELTMGTQADENGLVDEGKDVFATKDAIVASAILKGASNGMDLRAEWRNAEGRVISVNAQRVAQPGPLLARFSASPKEGWSVGGYRLVLLSGNTELASREFRIE